MKMWILEYYLVSAETFAQRLSSSWDVFLLGCFVVILVLMAAKAFHYGMKTRAGMLLIKSCLLFSFHFHNLS